MFSLRKIKELEQRLKELSKDLQSESIALRRRVSCLEGKHVPTQVKMTKDSFVAGVCISVETGEIQETCSHCHKVLATYKKEQEAQE